MDVRSADNVGVVVWGVVTLGAGALAIYYHATFDYFEFAPVFTRSSLLAAVPLTLHLLALRKGKANLRTCRSRLSAE